MDSKQTLFLKVCRGLIVFGILFVYLPLLSYDWLQIEDGSYYLRNPLLGNGSLTKRVIESWRQAPESNWMPLTWMLAIGLKSLFGLSATVFHLCSIILHVLNSLFVFRVAEKLKLSSIQALFVTSVFAFHPLQVESIAWASSLKGVLGASFAIIALDIFLTKGVRYKHLWLGLLFALSMLSKQTLLALPIVIVMVASTHRANILQQARRQWTLFILALTGGLAAMYANHNHPNVFTLDYIWQYPLKGFAALGHYTQSIFYPVALHPEYAFEKNVWSLPLLGGSVFLLAGVLFFRSYKQSVPLLAFIILLMPILGWWPSPLELAADRLIYFPLIFLLVALSGLFVYIKNVNVSIALVVLLSIGLGVMSRGQLAIWKSDEALCLHTLKHTPRHFLMKLNLGLIHARAGRFDTAERILRENVAEHPERFEPVRSLSQVLLANKKSDAAILAVREAKNANPLNRDYIRLLAETYLEAGYPEEAKKQLLDLVY